MAKKKNAPAADLPAPAKPAPPAPAPLSPEELRQVHIIENAKDSINARIEELKGLVKGSLQKSDQLGALAGVGEAIMSVALHTRARLRAAQGRTDASLATKAAYIKTQTRKALKIADQFETELTAWGDYSEAIKPAMEACARTVKDLDLPGMKAAIGCSGEALFDDEGAPAEKAAAAAAPGPAPEPPKVEPEPAQAPQEPAAAPAPATVQGRELPALAMAAGPVIDVEPEPAARHGLDGMDEGEAEEAVQTLLAELEDEGVREGLKRKDWKDAQAAWIATWPEGCDMAATRSMYDRVLYALEIRKPISWAVVTEKELFAHQRQLAVAAGE